MSKCYFCKKEYGGYPVIIDNHIECFLMEQHIKEMYYDEHNGVCKKCRDKEFYNNPVWKIRAWLSVRAQLMLGETHKEIDVKTRKKYKEAIERIKKYEAILEKTPEVKALYLKNNPAKFKDKPTTKLKCIYCGENMGSLWINDPNEEEPKIENCWWVCVTCAKIIEKQSEAAYLSCVNNRLEEMGIKTNNNRINELNKEIQDIAYEDQQEVTCIEIKKEKDGYKAKKIY